MTAGGFWLELIPTPARSLPAQVAGIGGPVGITTDGRSAPAYSGEWVTFKYGLAPAGLATYRRLAAAGLRPGGAQPVAQLSWWHGSATRIAYLYDVSTAVPKRPMTPAKQAALDKALLARRTCPDCGRDAQYVIPTSLGRCVDCEDGPSTSASATKRSLPAATSPNPPPTGDADLSLKVMVWSTRATRQPSVP